ncbi:hypothetical protein SM124_13250 [Bacillus sp. 31A1R]|uniref:Uncharacterized protein n=1 Tax=Robertmurraya mangrovi TaxID=3098077 RepID=A0ABU5IZV9_9BACI|nr:hypothetical protein [Bacillus sp. 31A1R]MDZ5472699.1 hypothetical protein [Bacillus sp. 31A1R]
MTASASSSSSQDDDEEWLPYDQYQFIFEEAYEDGAEAATEGYLFDDHNQQLKGQEWETYREGYYQGWMENGGESILETIGYYLFYKYLWWSLGAMALLVVGGWWTLDPNSVSETEKRVFTF